MSKTTPRPDRVERTLDWIAAIYIVLGLTAVAFALIMQGIQGRHATITGADGGAIIIYVRDPPTPAEKP